MTTNGSKLEVLTAVAEADAYDQEKAADVRADLIARGILVPNDDQPAHGTGGTSEPFETGDVREQARQEIRARAAAGLPELSGKQLGKLFGFGERWGRARIAEVGSSQSAASPVRAAARVEDDAARGAASGALAPQMPATPETPDTGTRHDPPPAAAGAAHPAADEVHGERPAVAVDAPEGAAPRTSGKPPRTWPVLLLALPAFVAIWGGWVGLGEMAGFGLVNLLPGIGDGWTINTAITLPIGVEAYAAYALWVWLAGVAPTLLARRFAMWSALGSLVLGMGGQVSYHLLKAAGVTVAPWQITTFVSCLPVVVLGCGAALAHLLRNHERD